MQSLSLHIEYLLRSHECVILPGIGAFLRTHKGATLCESGSIDAPRLQICFNSSIVSSDGLLCHSVARRAKITFEQASVLVSNAADECRNTLETYGELSVGRLGRLVMDDEQRISFMPYAIPFSKIWTDFTPLHSEQTAAKTAVDETSVSESRNSDYYIIHISRKAVRYAAIFAMCLLTATTLLLPSASRDNGSYLAVEKQYASVVPGVEKLGVCPNNTIAAHPEQKDTVKAEEPVSDVKAKKYYLIVATFTKESDCQKFIDARSDSEELAIINSGKVSRVYSTSSDDRDALVEILNSPSHKALYSQAWIWSNPSVSE